MEHTHQAKKTRVPNDGKTFLSEESLKDFSDSITDLSSRVRSASTEVAEKSIGFMKKYPIHSALGAALIGFLIGNLSQKSK